MSYKPLVIGKHVIPIPIIQGGMGVGISWDKLAGNVSKEGGLGVVSDVGSGYYEYPRFAGIKKDLSEDEIINRKVKPNEKHFNSPEATKEIMKNARKICGNAPIAINSMKALSTYKDNIVAACEAGADIIISGAGMAFDLVELTADYPDVALVPIIRDVRVLSLFIKKWGKINRKPDAVILEGPKSGGHQGFSFNECTLPENQLEETLPPVIELAKKHGIPVIVAGGVWDKNDIDKFMAMGASGVQMGTRFIGTFECDTSDYHKNMLLKCKKDDISLKGSPAGLPSSSIYANLHKQIEEGKAPAIKCISNCLAPCNRGQKAREVGYCIADRLADNAANLPNTALPFSGTNGYKLKEIISVRELIGKLIYGEDFNY